MMAPHERQQFILQYVHAHTLVNVLDQDFVDAYVSATGATAVEQTFGAPKCATLGRDLTTMFHDGLLGRERAGVSGMAPGFPTWVYMYHLPNDMSS